MRRIYMMALLLLAICLAATVGVGSTLSEEDGGIPGDVAAEGTSLSMVELGAFPFQVEQPRHVTYLVARMAAGFAETEQADFHSSPAQIVRLRNEIFDAVFSIRADAVTGEVDAASLQDRIERYLTRHLPALAMVEVQVLGMQDVPRR